MPSWRANEGHAVNEQEELSAIARYDERLEMPSGATIDRPLTMAKMAESYEQYYGERNPATVYPVEFVVRAFLGNYPRHRTNKADYRGQCVLDLGFGDGRNMPLLNNLGMHVFGVEISQPICDLTRSRMERLGVRAEIRIGSNSGIPFADSFFDALLACHSCYYVEENTRFNDNVVEIARVLKPGGSFVFSAPMASSFLIKGATDIGGGHMRITNDPYGLRNGAILKKFDTEAEIAAALAPRFESFAIGSCRNDFWGIEEHVWIVVCTRAA
jgi:SAM-dependent methyltransferase